MKNNIKLFDPAITDSEKKAIIKVLNSKFWASGSGSGIVSKFEENFSDLLPKLRKQIEKEISELKED